jgi:hypothetical protein
MYDELIFNYVQNLQSVNFLVSISVYGHVMVNNIYAAVPYYSFRKYMLVLNFYYCYY